MKNLKALFVIIVLCISIHSVSGQIFGGIMNSAKRKLEQKIEDKIVEAVSEEIARRAFKPIDQAMDSMMRQKYRDSINGGKDVDWEKVGENYAAFLNGMNKAVDLPEKYHFDVTQEVEMQDYDKRKNNVKIHYSKTESIIGMESIDDNNKTNLIIMDIAKDIIILYTTDDKGNKKGQAIPSVLKLASSFVQSASENEKYNYKIEKTGKTKKIAGFQSDEYKGSSAEENVIMYLSQKFPVDTKSNFMAHMKQFAPPSYNENMANSSGGVLMQYENTRKNESDRKTTWETKKVSEKSFDIINADYNFGMKE